MADAPVSRFAHALTKPFVPADVSMGGGSTSERQLLRIASASEYAAGQLYEIRQLLEKMAAK